MKKITITSLVAIALISLNSCSNLPSSSENEEAISEKIIQISNDKIELTKFKKTNAIENEVLGVKTYLVSFNGQIRYKEDGYISATYRGVNIFDFVKEKRVQSKNSMILEVFLKTDKNTIKNIKGELGYIKTENGWKTENKYIRIFETK